MELGKTDGHLCELGCGTGVMSARFADAGYEVTGIDNSSDMLALAEEKKKETQKILYLNQDITDFSLHKPADVVLCICDTMNYLLGEDDLRRTFCRVRECMAEDGVFIFDMKTEYCFSKLLRNEVRVEEDEDYLVIWDNEYRRKDKLNEYLITIFLRCEEDGRYERHDECHRQKAYEVEQIKELLTEAGLVLKDCFGADMARTPGEEEERIYFIVEKGMQ